MHPPEIFTAREENRDRVIQSLILGFSSDPLARWFWPEAATYLQAGPGLDAFGGRAIDSGCAYVIQNFEGVAMWMLPAVEPDEERMIPIFEATVAAETIEISRCINGTGSK